ncbi:colicin K immunity protein [Escherichia coli]|uniref:colicin K immunity protein n=1 Tax=Escherichia coli TaxID=562 RepID=UPI0009361744|nr:colicin K immunity protein [Escherichia coli]
MHLKYYLHNLPESLIPWILILIFNDTDNTPLLFIFISSIYVLLYPYSKLTISRYIKENTKLKKESWYLCKLSALFYLLMAIPVGLPSFIYYSLKRK